MPEPESPSQASTIVETIVELDRRAWSLPSPHPPPAGPVRDVWPVRSEFARGVENQLLEDPAAG